MSSIIEKKEEIVLTRAQFEKLRDTGKLIIGSTYKIKDDPTAKDLVDGIATSKRAEQDSNGNVIHTTYRKLSDSYSITDVDSLFNTKLANFYNKQETYTKAQVDYLVGLVPKFSVTIVTELPTEDITLSTIYLLAKEGSTNNAYDEYMYINDQWELIGSTSIDLSNYYTKEEIVEILAGKVDKTSTGYRVYGTDYKGDQIVYRINTANEATVNAIPYRGSNGAIYIPDASIEDSGNVVEGQQAVNKKYVQDTIASETQAREELTETLNGSIEEIYQAIENLSSFKGTWSSSETYKIGDIVVYNSYFHISLVDNNLNHSPTNSTSGTSYWKNINYSATTTRTVSSISGLLHFGNGPSDYTQTYVRTGVRVDSNGELNDVRGKVLSQTELDNQTIYLSGTNKVSAIALYDPSTNSYLTANDMVNNSSILIYDEEDEVL